MIRVLPIGIPLLLCIFFPFLQDYYDTGRWISMVIITMAVLAVAGVRTAKTKKIGITIPPLAVGFGAVVIASIISILVASTNKIEAITHPLGIITYLCLATLTILLTHLLTNKQKHSMLWSTIVMIGIIGLIAIYQQFSITSMVFPNVPFLANNLWNPTGTPISALYLFILGIPLTIFLLRQSIHQHKERLAALAIVCLVFMVGGSIATIWRFLPIAKTVVMPISIGWSVLLESLKSGKTALAGVGAENFLSAYALGRPISINQTTMWNTGFSTSASLFLHSATTLGLAGLIAYGILIGTIIKTMPKAWELRFIWIATSIIIIAFPPSIPLLIFLTIITVGTVSADEATRHEPIAGSLATLLVILDVLIIGATCIGLFRFTNAEILYSRAGNAVEKENNLTKAYNDYILAIRQNQYMTRYHISLSQLALVMGGSILSQAPKNDTTGMVTLLDEDKKLVTSLFSLAVSEAKLATSLAPNNYVSWTNLATIYQSLTGVATDATNWTIAAYQKAISLNPISPTIRIDFGGVYMNAKEYDNAITQFMDAVTLKPNYANAYYNLANAYKIKGAYQQAIQALKQTQTLLPTGSDEYTSVTKELQTLEQETPTTTIPTPTPTMVKPQPTTIPVIPTEE